VKKTKQIKIKQEIISVSVFVLNGHETVLKQRSNDFVYPFIASEKKS
jgi:flagellar biosynthesis regulator FlaF